MKTENNLAEMYPELAKQWHPFKNGDLTPSDVTVGSGRKVWWLVSYDDPNTGKHFDFEWQAQVASRVNGSKCPYENGKSVWVGYNDLATTHPQLAKEWNYQMNGNLKPTDVSAGSNKIVWWVLPYDDQNTGKHFDFEWQASISNRVKGNGCPYLSNQMVLSGYNDLETYCKEHNMEFILGEWDYQKNDGLKPSDVPFGSSKKVFWVYSYDDSKTKRHFDFKWEAPINKRVCMKSKCPQLENKALCVGFNDLATVNPTLAKEWHPYRNGDLKPTDVMANSHRKVWWLLPYDDKKTGKHFDFEWQATVANRNRGAKCPYLSKKNINLVYNGVFKNKDVEIARKNFLAEVEV